MSTFNLGGLLTWAGERIKPHLTPSERQRQENEARFLSRVYREQDDCSEQPEQPRLAQPLKPSTIGPLHLQPNLFLPIGRLEHAIDPTIVARSIVG